MGVDTPAWPRGRGGWGGRGVRNPALQLSQGRPRPAAGSAELWGFGPEPWNPGSPWRVLGVSHTIYSILWMDTIMQDCNCHFKSLRSSQHPTALCGQFTEVTHNRKDSQVPWASTLKPPAPLDALRGCSGVRRGSAPSPGQLLGAARWANVREP